MFILLIALCSCFINKFLSPCKVLEKNIVGIWKHHNDQVYLIFWEDNKMSLRIPLNYEVKGHYMFIEPHTIQLIFISQSYLMSGEVITSNPQILKISFSDDKLILYGIKKDINEGEIFIRIH